uniref:Cytochrome P450 2J2 n=1 Tax=Phallusia mammillata TaxID=59560 RepID=A0A6F9D9S7_9ASCI|nr:cytochrome P450 2J2 [Phallusia mammillata]
MDLITASLALCLLVVFLLHYYSKQAKNLPPGPTGFPFLGCIPYLSKYVERTFSQWSKTYGPVMFLKIGNQPTVVLSSFEAIHQAFVVQGVEFSNRYHTYFTKCSCEGGFGILFLHPYKSWKVQRTFGFRALMGKGLGGNSIETRILTQVEVLLQHLKQKNEQPFLLEDDLLASVANIIGDIIMKEYCDKEQNEKLLNYVFESVKSIRTSAFVFMAVSMFPWIRFFPPICGQFNEMKKGMKIGSDIFNEIIEQHLKDSEFHEARDFTDLFLLEYKRNTPGFSKKQLLYYLKDLIAGGVETSVSSIRWMCLHMVKYPEIQKKIHMEIDSVIGPDGNVTLSCDLPYTKAFIQEVFRTSPPAPIGVPRATTEDLYFMGYFIPKNTQVMANLWHVHHDPTIWPDPTRFDPERHLDNNRQFVKSDKIIAFSIGPRSCIGESLARKEIFLFFVSILQKFDVCGNKEHPVPCMKGAPGIVYSPYPYKFVMKLR